MDRNAGGKALPSEKLMGKCRGKSKGPESAPAVLRRLNHPDVLSTKMTHSFLRRNPIPTAVLSYARELLPSPASAKAEGRLPDRSGDLSWGVKLSRLADTKYLTRCVPTFRCHQKTSETLSNGPPLITATAETPPRRTTDVTPKSVPP